MLEKQDRENKLIAAICAAPTALKTHNIGKGKRITSYPSMKKELCDDYEYSEEKVVVDGITISLSICQTILIIPSLESISKKFHLQVSLGLIFLQATS